jgi:asparagine synthase (glutamine-hydrolysing)
MCGIAGILFPHDGPRATRDDLARMCQSIRHRGPDGEGMYIDADVMLGHRRLAVIDLHTGQQPMHDEQQRVTLVYNGEIYNYRELRSTLQQRGVVFRTESDTEVVLQCYLAYGEQCPSYFEGMFAFALWDHARKQLMLARDVFGIKPLYVARARGGFVFGSELKAVMASGLIDPQIDLQALDDYFAYGYIRAPRSICAGVDKVLPGHRMVVRSTRDGLHVTHEPYWQFPSNVPTPRDLDETTAVEELDRLVRQSVAQQMVSDVPIGTFLSGGLDSTVVTAAMAQQSKGKVQAFSIGFQDAKHDESPVAAAVAAHLGLQHHVEVVQPNAMQMLPSIAQAYDEPFGDPSALPTWYLSQMARREVTVCLSGDGGDELFGGYRRYRTFRQRAQGLSQPLRTVVKMTEPLLRKESRTHAWLARMQAAPYEQYGYFRNNFAPSMRRQLFSPDALGHIDLRRTQDLFQRVRPMEDDDSIKLAQLADIQGYLPDDVLTKVDRVSMAHSLEVRVPLLDRRILQFAWGLPPHLKIQGATTKVLLRKLLGRYVPHEIAARPKKGFAIPLRRWLREDLAGYTQGLLESEVFQKSPYFSGNYVRYLGSLRRDARVDVSFALWQLVMFGVWHEHVWKRP